MNTFGKIGLAAAAVCGVGLATAAPASAQEWRNRGHDHGRYERSWGHDGRRGDWRRDGWRRDWHGYGYSYGRPYYAWRDGCGTYWRWDAWRDRYVRVTRCY